MISVGIVGGTGYTGIELLRILVGHPEVRIQAVTSRSEAGKPVSALFPNLPSHLELEFTQPDPAGLKDCECVFFAAPNGTAMHMAPELIGAGVRVIDLAADFRIKDAATWEFWYKQVHACPDLLQSAVYGLPELNREQIRKTDLVANPGCYPTAVVLGVLPLLESGLADHSQVIADAKSGVSGAGRNPNVPALFSEAGENFKAYNVGAHRHWPEIKQVLQSVCAADVNLTFTPHLTPMVRGIFATLYVTGIDRSLNLHSIYRKRFTRERFVEVLSDGAMPETKHVRGSNFCRLSVQRPYEGDTVVILSVIDNLVKGAAGQAVQNMNIMFDLDEATGLMQSGLFP